MTNVFVSHSSRDQPFVLQRLLPCLEQAGLEVWCSATHIRTAANWERQIRTALAQCNWFIVLAVCCGAVVLGPRHLAHWNSTQVEQSGAAPSLVCGFTSTAVRPGCSGPVAYR